MGNITLISTSRFNCKQIQDVSISQCIVGSQMQWDIDSSWICFPRGPEDDLIKVETCRPNNILIYCIQNKILFYWLTGCIYTMWHTPLLCLQWKTPDDGQRNCPKHVEFYSKNKFEKLVHLVGFIIRIYHEFRPDPACKLSGNLYDIHHCCVYSEKLLMMDRGTVRNM